MGRIKLTKIEKEVLGRMLSRFEDENDDSFAEMSDNPVTKMAFLNLCQACGCSTGDSLLNQTLNQKNVKNCLKKLGS